MYSVSRAKAAAMTRRARRSRPSPAVPLSCHTTTADATISMTESTPWADPLAALVVLVYSVREARHAWRQAQNP
jgi:hypothetical protein